MSLTQENAKYHCRICLMKLESESGALNCLLQSIEFRNLMERFLKINGPENEGYPQNVCNSCYDQIQCILRFEEMASESTRKLQILFDADAKDPNQKPDVEETDSMHKDALMETETVILNSLESDLDIPDFLSTEQSAELANNSLEDEVFSEASVDSNENNNNNNEFTAPKSNENQASSPITHINDVEERTFSDGEDKCSIDYESAESHLKISEPTVRQRKCKKVNVSAKKRKSRLKPKSKIKEESSPDPVLCKSDILESKTSDDAGDNCKVRRHRQKGSKNNFKCTQCTHGFASKITLDAHVRKVHEGSKRPFQCDRCDKSYSFIGGLYTHIKEIHEATVRSYPCDFGDGCGRVYTSFIAMLKHKRTKHMATEADIKKFVCEQCGATFNQSSNLSIHRRNKHSTVSGSNTEKPSFECQICKKNFHSRYTLKYHTLQLHSNETKFECNVCGRRLAKKFMLVQHMLVHSTDKTPCEHCGKLFVRKFELSAHIKAVHMKLKPYECRYCSDSFASKKTLRHHEYIHTGEKPYVCDLCGQAFRQQTCLKTHKKTHEKTTATEFMVLQKLQIETNQTMIENKP